MTRKSYSFHEGSILLIFPFRDVGPVDDPSEGAMTFCEEPGREASGGSVGGSWCCMVPGGGGAGEYRPATGMGPCPNTIVCGGGPAEGNEVMEPGRIASSSCRRPSISLAISWWLCFSCATKSIAVVPPTSEQNHYPKVI